MIQTSDFRFMRRGPNRLNYFLGIKTLSIILKKKKKKKKKKKTTTTLSINPTNQRPTSFILTVKITI
jgi:hypothetical protein